MYYTVCICYRYNVFLKGKLIVVLIYSGEKINVKMSVLVLLFSFPIPRKLGRTGQVLADGP